MKTNAISVANYLIDKAVSDKSELRQFGLMKRVYIIHGFSLSLLDRPAIDSRFDRVEAWKNGPVIPSVYHSFKHNKNNPITEPSVIVDWDGDELNFEAPELKDGEIKEVADMVWERYADYSDFEMIELLHKKGSIWDRCYVPGKNVEIPDSYTKFYYDNLIEYEKRNYYSKNRKQRV